MKKSKKILLASVCASAIALTTAPIAIGLNQKNTTLTNNDEIVSKNEDFGIEVAPWQLNVKGQIVAADEYTVSISTRYYNDRPEFYAYQQYWETSFDNVTWNKASWLDDNAHSMEDYTFDRQTTGNYYIRRVVVWSHKNWFDLVFRTSESFLIGRKLHLSGTTQETEDHVNFDFTVGVSSKNDLVRLILMETDDKFQYGKDLIENIGWTSITDIAKPTSRYNDYLYSKRIAKQDQVKYYKLIVESMNIEVPNRVLQRNELKFSVVAKEEKKVSMSVYNFSETDRTSSFNFNFELNANDLISYKIVEVQSLYGEVLREEQNFVPIQSIATKTNFGYKFSKSFDKVVSNKPTQYKIYADVKRSGSSKISKGSYSFNVNPRKIDTNIKKISSQILTDANAMSNFFLFNGGFSSNNINRLNNLPLSIKYLYLNQYFIYNSNTHNFMKEFENIQIYLSSENASSIKLGVVYLTREDYTLSNGAKLDQKFFDIRKA